VGEGAANQDAAIGLDENRAHGGIRTRAGIEGGVERTIGIDTGDTGLGESIDAGEVTADKHLAIGLSGQGIDNAVEANAEIVKSAAEGAVGVQESNAGPAPAIESGEGTADGDAAVRQNRDRINWIVRARARVKEHVE